MVTKKPVTAPPIDLAAFAAEHLFYETQTFLSGRTALASTTRGTFAMNSMVEICALHLRNLIDFFYLSDLSDPKPDDVIADHYVQGWDEIRPPIVDAPRKARERANKELAHLTAKRIAGGPPEKAWNFGALSAELKPVIDTFLGRVDTTFPANARAQLLLI